jgi:beta-phosphoglucomutase-like phosphatase (HAD superfamily)
MKRPTTVRVITRDLYDAVLFYLDGVITDTASFHATCWKQMLDEYLQNRARERGEPFKPFDVTTDYLHYVDGKQRSDGVRDFLKSRGIALPERSADDEPSADTGSGLGNPKSGGVPGKRQAHPAAAPPGI